MALTNPALGIFNMTLPAEGPVTVPITLTLGPDEEQEIDLTEMVNNGVISFISGVQVDTLDVAIGGDGFQLENRVTGQRLEFWEHGYFMMPVFCPNPPRFLFRSLGTSEGVVRLHFVNFPIFPIWY